MSEELFRYLEREVTLARAAQIEAQLESDPAMRQQLERLRGLLDDLRAPDPASEGADFAAGVRAAFATGRRAARRPAHRRRWIALLSLAAGAAVLSVLPRKATAPADGYQARSAAGSAVAAGERWAGIRVFRAARGEPPSRLGERLGREDGLLFAYENGGPRPFSHLMIFAVDGGGRVFWFYPAFRAAGEDPEAIAIDAQPGFVELPDRITQELSAGPLALYGVFLRRPARVSEVEQEVERAVRDLPSSALPAELPIAESAQQRISVMVDP